LFEQVEGPARFSFVSSSRWRQLHEMGVWSIIEYDKFEFVEVTIMKKTNKNTSMGMALGMCFGVSIGTAIGSTFDNMAMGTSLGMCIGMAIGLALGSLKDKEVNKQVEEEGYTIKDIKKDEEKEEYIITIVNRLEEESIVIVPKGQMEEENFQIDDVVFLNDDGLIEQAYDKDDE